MPLTPDAKRLLAETIRGTQQDPDKGLRAKLLRAIHDEADRRYRLSVPIDDAGLDEAHRRRRERIEAWIDEHARAAKPKNKTELKATKDRLLAQAEKEAAATLINRLVLLRQLEALGLSKPPVLTGGWRSKAYNEFRRDFAPALCVNGTTDATEGYATLLQLVFDELAIDLPGLFGDVGLTRLFPIPPATLREVVERLDDAGLASAWTDDTTLGWVYQYWNDPDREALDAKINPKTVWGSGKIEPHEIASKTQMFTERYMVEWLLQNSLGLTWLCMCQKYGWTPDADRVLPVLETRRAEWRTKREAGEVALDALMPIHGELEDRWKYYVSQPIPDDAVANAPQFLCDLKILDPACGSGHFLVIAFDLLAALYREEARHRGQSINDREIAESILEKNLHGIDIDPRATQIAAAALYLKAKTVAGDVRPRQVNLVAPVLRLGLLPADDSAVVQLREELEREVGIPEDLTNKLLTALAGVDYLGSLLKVDTAIEDALRSAELEFERAHGQGDLYKGFPAQQVKLSVGHAKATILDKVEHFLANHAKSGDLGLRLDGEQLGAGVRFVRIAQEGRYDVVVGNPPYQGVSKTNAFGYVTTNYPRGKADLFAAFIERTPQLLRSGGVAALLTMRSWMFAKQYASLRRWLLHECDLRALGDIAVGAFDEVPNDLLSVVISVFRKAAPTVSRSVAVQPTPLDIPEYDRQRTARKRAATLAHVGRYEFDPRDLAEIAGEPIVYWWGDEELSLYREFPLLGDTYLVAAGVKTGDDSRFLRMWFEVDPGLLSRRSDRADPDAQWQFYIKGAAGAEWIEPASQVLAWSRRGLELRVFAMYRAPGTVRLRDPSLYFRLGIAFSPIGASFSARAHRLPSIFGNMGSSVFASDIPNTLCTMNSTRARRIVQALNPGLHFENEDVGRLPLFSVNKAEMVFNRVEAAFSAHESCRESSLEFDSPGPSPWRYAQSWAQAAVDRPAGASLPSYEPDYDETPPEGHVSFALGVALGRFRKFDASTALPHGICFVSVEKADSLQATECALLHDAWMEHGATIAAGSDLRTYLRKSFFSFHRKLYSSRPIYFPLSSATQSFVALVSIHRWRDDTLNVLLADHLMPTKRRLEGELDDLRAARATGKNRGRVERRFTEVQRLRDELMDFIDNVTEVAEKGPPLPDDKTPKREVDSRYVMDLDDGVMVNSAALWPLLEPHWKEPKKWWRQLAAPRGKMDYDWSHLAARYFPSRVRKKCYDDPSLAVAHKCFWALHPEKAFAWELRLQDEIGPDFTIDEPGSDDARAKFLAGHEQEAGRIRADEMKRRNRKAAKVDNESGPLFENTDGDDEVSAEDQDEESDD